MPYFLSCLAIFKNEAVNLREWIEHYLWQGVEHFYLINNGSTDNYKEVLEPYQNVISLFERPERYVQKKHYNEIFNTYIKGNSKWLAVVDLDEFFYCNRKLPIVKTVADLLLYYAPEEHAWGGLYSAWKLFGSSGIVHHPYGRVRESFVYRSDGCWQPKGIVLVDKVRTLDIHIHDHEGEVCYGEFLRLNHYAIQSQEFYSKVKMTRGDATHEPSNTIRDVNYFIKYDYRDSIDDELKKLVEEDFQYKYPMHVQGSFPNE